MTFPPKVQHWLPLSSFVTSEELGILKDKTHVLLPSPRDNICEQLKLDTEPPFTSALTLTPSLTHVANMYRTFPFGATDINSQKNGPQKPSSSFSMKMVHVFYPYSWDLS